MRNEGGIDVKDLQKLVNIIFEIALTISDPEYDLCKKSNEEKALWVARQLRNNGIDTQPCGASWGRLVTTQPLSKKD